MGIGLTVLCEIIDQCLSQGKKVDIRRILTLIDEIAPYESAFFALFNIECGLIKSIHRFVAARCTDEWLDFFRQNNRVMNNPVVLQAIEAQRAFEWCDGFLVPSYRGQHLSGSACRPGRTKGIAYAYPFSQESGRLSFLSLQVSREQDTQQHRLIMECILLHIHHALSSENVATKLPSRLGLSSRELEVLKWVGHGKRSKEIGHILDISENTVKYHLSNVFMKLNVSNRTQAITKAINHKLISD